MLKRNPSERTYLTGGDGLFMLFGRLYSSTFCPIVHHFNRNAPQRARSGVIGGGCRCRYVRRFNGRITRAPAFPTGE